MPKPPRTQKDVANAFQQAVGTLREAWKSNEKISKARDATLKRYCLHAPGEPHAGNHKWRVLTEEPYFQAPGDEKCIKITDREFTMVDLIKKCPDFIEEFGSEPVRADALRPAHPPSGDDNNPLLIKLLKEKLQGVENENNDLKQKNETLRNENDALQQQGQGAEEPETDVGLEELRDKVQQQAVLLKRTEAGLNVIGRGEKPLNHTMRALQLDFCPQDVKDARMDCYNYWLQKACDYCNITGNQLAKQLKEKYPEYNRFVNTLTDFEVRLWAMREDLACYHVKNLLGN